MTLRRFCGISPQLGEAVFVDPAAVVIGDVHLGSHSSVWPTAVIRGDDQPIRIGARCNVQDGAVLHVTGDAYSTQGWPLIIGDDVTIGHGAVVHACTLGNRILVGMNATVLDGAVIEDDVIIAAGAVVTPGKRLQSGFLYVGSPARQARPLTEAQRAFLPISAKNYTRLAQQCIEEDWEN